MPNKFPSDQNSALSGDIPMVLWIVDRRGHFVLVEGDKLPCLHLSKDDVIGKSIHDIYDHVPHLIDSILQALEGNIEQGTLHHQNKIWSYRTYPSRENEGVINGAVGLAFDITKQQERIRKQEALDQLSKALQKINHRADMPQVILDKIMNLLASSHGLLISNYPYQGEMVIEAASGLWSHLQGKLILDENLNSLVPQTDLILDTGQPLIQNFAQDPLTNHRQPLSIAGSPLTSEGQTDGLVLIANQQEFSEEQIQLLTDLCDLTGNAMRRSARHERTERRLHRISALHAIDQAITGSFDLKITLEVLLNQVISQLEIDAVDIYLYNSDLNILEYINGRGFTFNTRPGQQLAAGEGLPWLAVERRGLIRLANLADNASVIYRKNLLEKEGFVAYYGFPLIVKGKIKGVMEIFHRQPLFAESEWIDFYKTLATQAAIAIDNARLVEDLRQSNLKLDQAYHATLEGWVQALDLRDKETEGHTQRVTKRAERLAKAMGITGEALVHLRRGALLHDIGKLGVPDEILNKPGPLNEEEWALMKKHPEYAKQMLSPIEFLHPALAIPTHHHEKWDGSGYPQNLKGAQIPLEARIFSVIDVWDALTSDRPYRPAWDEAKAFHYILTQKGKHFDPQVIEVWMKVFDIPEIHQAHTAESNHGI